MSKQHIINFRDTLPLSICLVLPIAPILLKIDVLNSHIMMLAVMSCFGVYLLNSTYRTQENGIKIEVDNVTFLTFIFIITAFITTSFFNRIPNLANHYVHEMLYGGMLYLMAIFSFQKNKNTIDILFTINLLLMLVFIGQYWYVKWYLNYTYEFRGLLKTKHFLSIYLIVSLLMSFDRKLLNKYLVILFVALTVLTVIDTGSRISILSLFVAGVTYWILRNPRAFKTYYILLLISLLIIFTFALYQIRPASVNGRFLLWEIGLNGMEWKHLLFGRGLGFIEYYIADLQGNFMASQTLSNRQMAGEVKTVLNEYIRFFVETGLIGLCFIGTMIYLVLKNLYKERLIGTISAWCAFLVCCLASYPLLSPTVQVLLIFLFAFSSISCKNYILTLNLSDPKSKLPNVKKIGIGLCIAVFLGVLSFRHINYASDLLRWRDVSDLQHQTNEYYFRNEYQELFKSLHGDPRFLHDYAARLQSLDDYEAADTVLSLLVSIQPTYKRYLMLGYNYEAMAKYDLAESFYIKAENILPNAFMPKYMLFDLYRISEDKPKATQMAKYILSHPVKVKNENISHIKNEAINYLKNLNQML